MLSNRKKNFFKGIIFDLDGTLIDSMKVWDHVGTEFLISHQIEPPEDIERILKPMSFHQSAEYFKKNYQINQSPEEIMKGVYEKAADQYKHSILLKEFVKEYIEGLYRDGVRMCVATASDRTLAEAALKRLDVLQYLEFIMTCDEVGTGKDEPKIYLMAAEKLELDKGEICVFEDALYCAKTAKEAGFHVTGVYDESSKSDLEEMQGLCDRFIISFQELLIQGGEL